MKTNKHLIRFPGFALAHIGKDSQPAAKKLRTLLQDPEQDIRAFAAQHFLPSLPTALRAVPA